MNAKLRVLKITNPDNSREQIYVTPVNRVVRGFYQYTQDIKQYFASPVWIPSFSLALLHLSALSYAATFITFLLNSGISLPIITIARAAGSVVEISTQLPVLLSISLLSSTSASPSSLNLFLTFLTLFLPLSLSRLGLWTYDLTTTQLVQTLHPSTSLSAFSGAENTFIAFFELTQHVCGIIWARPEDFVWIASVGVGSVGVSAVLYAGWVRRVRGHLVHWRWGCKGI
ncbi:putative Solute carrier family 40 member 1 [Glarea lozoyensis 74030]|uniref:Solute carrier family 40 member n=1 Tax=Glarea lozoyensis (strain ATCC 74030 / MF5533) TaxID=1104152 RepID=H0ES59_GLAL7|nr:putative Solute carrier family 40 member 1 [Glarea lozoyensis 74030]